MAEEPAEVDEGAVLEATEFGDAWLEMLVLEADVEMEVLGEAREDEADV